jgi:signal transduction histidine kinase
VRDLQQSFVAEQLLHGPGGDSLAAIRSGRSLIRRGLNSPYIAEAVVSLTLEDRPEIFLVPFTYANDHPGDPHVALAAYTPYPLGDPAKPFGRLYLKLDGTIVQRINWGDRGDGPGSHAQPVRLAARVWSQESSLARTTIELNERRRELIRLERLALAGQISAGLLHDLRKPVLNIRHGLEEMHEALGDFAPAAAPLQELQENTHLFFEMLGEARIERFVRSDQVGEEFVDVGPVIDYSFNLVRYEQRGVTVERHQERNLPPVYAHPFKMIQLFSNLILNAYQAMGGHGKLTIELGRADGGVLARVTDTGPGIAPEKSKAYFRAVLQHQGRG